MNSTPSFTLRQTLEAMPKMFNPLNMHNMFNPLNILG